MNAKRPLALAAVCLITLAARAQAQPATPGTYTVDATDSDVHWLVYRSGALARFGHNHVISVARMTGRVELADEWSDSSFEIEIPVASLVVDDAELRAAQGEEFSSEPSEDDIAGTRRNMLSESLLNAEAYPTLRIRGEAPSGTPGDGEVRLELAVAGHESTVTAPVSVAFDGDALTVTGSFEVTHEQLGLEPFKALAGALRVAQQIDISYRIVARREADDAAR